MSKYRATIEIELDVADGALGLTAKEWAEKIAKEYLEMAFNYRSIGAERGKVVSVKKMLEVKHV